MQHCSMATVLSCDVLVLIASVQPTDTHDDAMVMMHNVNYSN